MIGSWTMAFRSASEKTVDHNFGAHSTNGAGRTTSATNCPLKYHHESNGHADCAVREVKNYWLKLQHINNSNKHCGITAIALYTTGSAQPNGTSDDVNEQKP